MILHFIVSFLSWFVISTLSLLALFVIIAKAQQFVRNKPQWVRTAVVLNIWPIVVHGILLDAIYNFTYAVVPIFWEFPKYYPEEKDWQDRVEWLLTWRLKRYLKAGPINATWRWYLAVKICDLIERIDPGHCAIKS